ncbi:hypothetical protein Tsubulata_024442 [Turnera subulata]|uniref:GH18 domain-containing protein n=1 Tax=Turnera subulata TaxID=218843 RepID=A0A9Q0FAJ1_9ROSI|nr:hypothetical protein Tsubulata_024442 [Turnera subulata]
MTLSAPMPPLLLVITLAILSNSVTISSARHRNYPAPAPSASPQLPLSPAYGPGPVPSPSSSPADESSPYYASPVPEPAPLIPGPSPDSYPPLPDSDSPVPTSPSYSWPPSGWAPSYPGEPMASPVPISPSSHWAPSYPGEPMASPVPISPSSHWAPSYPADPIASPAPAPSPIAYPPAENSTEPYPGPYPSDSAPGYPTEPTTSPSPTPSPTAYPPSVSPEPTSSPCPEPYSGPGEPVSSPPPPTAYPPSPAASPPYPKPGSQGIKAAYWPSFDGYEASAIDTSYFTHIYYAFLELEPATPKLNVTPFDQEKIPGFIAALRGRNPPVKTLLSIGGAAANQTLFAEMAATPETRAAFINSTIEVARQYGFHGLDLDWEYPANDKEMSDLGSLFMEWYTALYNEAVATGKTRLLLTAAVYYSWKFTNYGEPRAYPVGAINKYVDWVNPMCYDYYGPWVNITGPNSGLNDPKSNNLSTTYGIGTWIRAGASPEKLVMGLPLYGHTWTLQDPYDNGFGAVAVDAGPGNGTLNYNQILEFISENKAVVHYEGEIGSYYTYAGNIWIGYDDVMSIDSKIKFAKSMGLRGYFFWALGQDNDWTLSRLGKPF